MSAIKYKKGILDLETTGFNKPGVLQFSMILTNEEDLIVGYYNRYFLNDRPIEQDAIDKAHGLTEEILHELTDVYFTDNIHFIRDLLDSCETIYAHNSNYDVKQVLNPIMLANGMQQIEDSKVKCTSTLYTDICKLPPKPNANYKYKFPKLAEAIKYLNDCGKVSTDDIKKQFAESFECEPSEHDALYDAYLCYMLVKHLGK